MNVRARNEPAGTIAGEIVNNGRSQAAALQRGLELPQLHRRIPEPHRRHPGHAASAVVAKFELHADSHDRETMLSIASDLEECRARTGRSIREGHRFQQLVGLERSRQGALKEIFSHDLATPSRAGERKSSIERDGNTRQFGERVGMLYVGFLETPFVAAKKSAFVGIVALFENHQLADGSVRVPPALRPHLGGLEVLQPI